MSVGCAKLPTWIELRPIRFGEWLPDRCLPADEPFDPSRAAPESGCSSMCGFHTRGSREKLEALYREVLEANGFCGFVAWVGRRVVGYNNFFSREIARRTRFYGWGEREDEGDKRKTLVHHCVSLLRNPAYRRKGIGTRLISRSLDWAKDNGWQRFEVHLVLPDVAAGFAREQKSCRGFWSSLGFVVIGEHEALDTTKEAYGVGVRYSMALDLEKWAGSKSSGHR